MRIIGKTDSLQRTKKIRATCQHQRKVFIWKLIIYWYMNTNFNTLGVSNCASVWHLGVVFMKLWFWRELIAIDKLWGKEMSKKVHKKIELQLRGFNWFTSDCYCNKNFPSTQIGLLDTATTGFIAHVNSSNWNRFFMVWR